ncbi:polymerase [Leptospira hartskeerlii]|uniref:Polymerase n=1 Tax=Leptospira hartskeerlii TaxID=2023177 RepID=A0A2M9XA22_9LEPT|nr:FapA family protein [Leptospira hartskeerlii]PJZ24494.1 polymerase [Leptospira hartskeerlii]PJZ32894.1 polymerase [Leptospira hartskeerlii]
MVVSTEQTSGVSDQETSWESVFSLKISSDNLGADLTIRPGMIKGRALSTSIVIEYLHNKDISQDRIIGDNIYTALKQLQTSTARMDFSPISFVVAQGFPPVKGEDGWVKFYHPQAQRVKIGEDGHADYRNIERYIYVKAGEKLATLFEGIPGKPGMDVFGKPIAPPPIKRPKLTIGKNVQEKGLVHENKPLVEYFATCNGAIFSTESSITVSQELQIDSNVGLGTGNINYDGNVLVKGDVEAATSIKTQGNLMVKGNVESSDLVIARDLEVSGGIKGDGKNVIKIGGHLYAKFIENAEIEVDGDVVVEGFILNSKIHSLGNVILNGSSGNLVSSTVSTYMGLTCATLGSQAELDVTVELGFHFRNEKSFQDLTKRLQVAEKEIEKIVPKVQQIKQMVQRSRGQIPEDKKEGYRMVFEEYNKQNKFIELVKQKLEVLKSSRFNTGEVQLVVRKGSYKGSIIKYRRQVEKVDKFQSAFMMRFQPGQDKAAMVAIKPQK